MASALGGIEVPLHVRFVIDDRTRAALVALGWSPPTGDRWPVAPPPEGVGQYDPDEVVRLDCP